MFTHELLTYQKVEGVRFLMQKGRARKYRTKHFPCDICLLYTFIHSFAIFFMHFKSSPK